MPILSGLLLALFNFLVNVFLKFFDVRKAWALAMAGVISLGLLAALYMSFVSCINSCVPVSVFGAKYGNALRMGVGLIFNSVTSIAFFCWVAAFTACSLYVWKVPSLNILMKMV
jgi:hypothetical protein